MFIAQDYFMTVVARLRAKCIIAEAWLLLLLIIVILCNGVSDAKSTGADVQVSGTWDARFDGTVEKTKTSQDDTFIIELKQDGSKVTGTLRFEGLDVSLPVVGKVEGNTFSYTSKAMVGPDCELKVVGKTIVEETTGRMNGSQTQANCEGTAVGQVTAVRR